MRHVDTTDKNNVPSAKSMRFTLRYIIFKNNIIYIYIYICCILLTFIVISEQSS
jgi:hypothetical protein